MRWSIHASWSGEKGGLNVGCPDADDNEDEEPPPAVGVVEVEVAGVVVVAPGAPVDAGTVVEEDEVAIGAIGGRCLGTRE